jgi:hypothetical protein
MGFDGPTQTTNPYQLVQEDTKPRDRLAFDDPKLGEKHCRRKFSKTSLLQVCLLAEKIHEK